jgi:pimeloyl-ACP methyl ester carboxylesterase
MRDDPNAIVVLVPGLWMPSAVMFVLERQLERAGFLCTRFGYASGRAGLEENSERLAAFVRGLGRREVYLVGHSLGGVVALHAAATHRLTQVRRIVLLGSPYRDCFVARRVGRMALGRRLVGRTVPQWLASAKPPAPPGTDVGVIAGTRAAALVMLLAPGMPRPHDGVIRTEETRVPGMAAYAEVPICHVGMVVSRRVGRLVARFLAHGRFGSADAPSGRTAGQGYALGRGHDS